MELLVAAAMALTVIAALANMFSRFSRAASDTQSIIAMSTQLRTTATRLRQDLAGVTAPLTPPVSPDASAGYFELVEGPGTDFLRPVLSGSTISNMAAITGTDSILGDVDDILMFTTRSPAAAFTGRFTTSSGTGQIESQVAEVAWFCRPMPLQPVSGLTLQNLYRRKLLVLSYVGAGAFQTNANNQLPASETIPSCYDRFDISVRHDPTVNLLVPNSLADLARRENRFVPNSPSSSLVRAAASGTSIFNIGTTPYVSGTTHPGIIFTAASNRIGEDVVMGNVIGFDVRVYDPDAQPRLSSSMPVYPHEQGFGSIATTSTTSFRGGFVDLGCLATGSTTVSSLTAGGNTKSGLAKTSVTGSATYDTWTTLYESNGLDDDGTLGVDQGINGVDDSVPTDGLPDDASEDEAPPPYSRRVPAIEVRIRCYDPASKQIRQTTIRKQFPN